MSNIFKETYKYLTSYRKIAKVNIKPSLNQTVDREDFNTIINEIITAYDAIPVPIPGVTDHTLLANIGTNTHVQIDSHIANTSNPHAVTKLQVGLGNVDNTSDASKPVSTAQQTEINKIRDLSFYRRKGGIWHTPVLIGNLTQSFAAVANTVYLKCFTVSGTITITDLGYNVTLTGTSTLARCGIYSSNANREPDAPLADSGNLGVTLGAKSVTLGTPLVLSAGLYWTAYVQNGTMSVSASPSSASLNFIGSSTGISIAAINGFNKVITYGALPTLTGLTQNVGFIPFAWWKIS
jgi:hypothetical protein